MRACPTCGGRSPDEARFCMHCGADLSAGEPDAAPAPENIPVGGDGDDPGGDVTGPTAGGPELSVLVSDGFEDNEAEWEDAPQNAITRLPSLNERYRFEITDQAPANAFAVSIGGARGFDVVDQGVSVTSTLVEKGGGGLLNSFGVTCRYTGEDGYYFLISSSGRYVIENSSGEANRTS